MRRHAPVAELRVTQEALTDPAALEAEWRGLESDASFFLSWDWVGPLLHSLPPTARPELVRIRSAGRTVALALVGRTVQRRRGWIRSRTLHLNETGLNSLDCITLEHNDVLALPGHADEATAALLRNLAARSDWDELSLAGLAEAAQERWAHAAQAVGLRHHVHWRKDFHFIDLDAARAHADGLLGLLSANSRHQIRRSMKLYAQRGALALERAGSAAEARVWLAELAALHQAHWVALGQPGAFGTEFQRRFHETLVMRGADTGAAEIVRVKAGATVVGYLYNLRKDGTLYNYQTGFTYEADTRLKPGLVSHVMAADDAARRGLERYDLLMGGGHYKQRLANGRGTMVWSVVQQRRWALGLEAMLRRLAARLAPSRPAGPPATDPDVAG